MYQERRKSSHTEAATSARACCSTVMRSSFASSDEPVALGSITCIFPLVFTWNSWAPRNCREPRNEHIYFYSPAVVWVAYLFQVHTHPTLYALAFDLVDRKVSIPWCIYACLKEGNAGVRVRVLWERRETITRSASMCTQRFNVRNPTWPGTGIFGSSDPNMDYMSVGTSLHSKRRVVTVIRAFIAVDETVYKANNGCTYEVGTKD